MDRRHILKLMGASALVGMPGVGTRAQVPLHVAVVGGGIVGASIAYHLTRAGAQVTLLERGELATRASRGTFAWINATWAKQPRHYHAFNQAGVHGWHRLQAELNIPMRWQGSLEWFPGNDRQTRLRGQIAEQVEWNEPARMVPADELAALEPHLMAGFTDAAYSPNDGAVDPVLATQILASQTQALGASIKTGCGVRGVVPAGQSLIVDTSCGPLAVDKVVLATGADPEATRQFAGIEIPQRSTPGVIVVTKPHAPLLKRIIAAPGVHMHQRSDGRIVLGEQDGAPETEAHAERLKDRPNLFPDDAFAAMHADRILAAAQEFVPRISEVEVEHVYIGWRPLPLDGHPVLGVSPQNPKIYLAITHSGVTLAPIIGEMAAAEIMGGFAMQPLAPYRPDRSFERIKRY